MACCFFDIDGTIADNGVLVDDILSNFHALQKNGHKVFICSGRAFHYVDAIFQGHVDGYITSNGRCGYLNGKRLYHKPLPKEAIISYANDARQAHAVLVFQGEQQRLIRKEDAEMYASMKQKMNLYDAKIWEEEDVYNFNAHYECVDTLMKLRLLWKDQIILNDHHNGQSSDASMVDFDKGDGVKAIVSYLQEHREDTYAFGDGENDLAMFRSCAHRIAMENAVDSLKLEATYISNHFQKQGVQQALYHYRLLK